MFTILLAARHKRSHPALTPAGEDWYLIYQPRRGGRLSWPVTRSHTVTHPSTNRARRRVTSLIETSALPLSHATNLKLLKILKFFYHRNLSPIILLIVLLPKQVSLIMTLVTTDAWRASLAWCHWPSMPQAITVSQKMHQLWNGVAQNYGIDFDDIWQKYSKDARIEFACFSFCVGLLFYQLFVFQTGHRK